MERGKADPTGLLDSRVQLSTRDGTRRWSTTRKCHHSFSGKSVALVSLKVPSGSHVFVHKRKSYFFLGGGGRGGVIVVVVGAALLPTGIFQCRISQNWHFSKAFGIENFSIIFTLRH